MNNLNLTDIRGELQDAANIMRFIVEVTSTGVTLSDQAYSGLLDVGMNAVDRLDKAAEALRNYEAGNVPS